jgi:hypothetical protein
VSRLLRGALQRLGGGGGDPVVELQTNFGGGKTHSMLALYHMAGTENPAGLTDLDQLIADAGVTSAPCANRKFWTSQAPSKVPLPRSPVSAVSQLPPSSPPE